METWAAMFRDISHGKRVGIWIYFHVSAVPHATAEVVSRATEIAGCGRADFNVVRFSTDEPRVSLLLYPSFFEDGFPPLLRAFTIDLASEVASARSYDSERNPPILHRKELLLAPDHPRRDEFSALSMEAESLGLLRDVEIIGHRLQWEEELRARGLAVVENRLVSSTEATPRVERHRTAIGRGSLSAPMKALWRHGFLDGKHSVFDYGCGRGDDLGALKARSIEAEGWDPYYRPEGQTREADVVNLGYVLNVIEDLQERREALTKAFALARQILSVSALIGGRTAYERCRLFRDGVLTGRGTFQKYFTHAELGQYVAVTLGREPVSIAPGLYFVFRSDAAEQEFLERSQRSRAWSATTPLPATQAREKLPRPPREPRQRVPRSPKPSRWDLHAELLESFWQTCLQLGRLPEAGEFAAEADLRTALGAPKRVLGHLVEARGEGLWERARRHRMDDLRVYFALNLFERRKSFASLPERARADVRAFWRSYSGAIDEARALLFSISKVPEIDAACCESAARGVGFLQPNESLHVDTRLLRDLPPILRVYVGCAAKLAGSAEEADVVKIHIRSGKVSLLHYDDYLGLEVPHLIERVKVDLSRQEVFYFEYGDKFPVTPLYLKSRYMNRDCEGHDEQRTFDDAVLALGLFDFGGFGPDEAEFARELALHAPHLLRRDPAPEDRKSDDYKFRSP